jgi:hypothetical protein
MKLTNAVSGLARSGATRSGYPVLQGARVPLFALSNVARSGATRSNYVGSKAFINIGGIDYGSAAVGDGVGILAESLTKSDAINNTPVTLAFTARGWVPVEGTEVVITIGSKNNLRREFGGTILRTRHRYVGDKPVAENMLFDVSCIDYTWALDRRKVSGNYTRASVAAIAASLLTFAPAGYTLRVDPDIGAEILDQITFTEQVLSSAFTQLVKRVGGDFLCDFAKVVHLFYENTALSPPRIVNAVHPSLATISFERDLSQVATRVLGSFGGSNALAQITPGDIFLPVETTAWYLPQGGTVLVGQQRVNYSGLDGGGRGSLVGPGAAPTSMPNAALQPGAGVDVGSHDYAVTYQTAQGESIPGPRLTLPVGSFLPPSTAPTAGAPVLPGAGPDQGAHDYAVSFVISTGETVPGPRLTASTTLLADPTSAPTPDAVNIGPGPDPGAHDYAVTFLAPNGGETLPGPIGEQIVTGGIPAPANPPSLSLSSGPGPDPGEHLYAYTFVRPEGETTSSAGVSIVTGIIAAPGAAPQPGSVTEGTGPDAGGHSYACTFVGAGGETTAGPQSIAVQTGVFGPAASPPQQAPTCVQYPNSGNYAPASGGGNVGDWVSYVVSYTTDGTWVDESKVGPGSAFVQIQASLNGYPNQCQRSVTIGAPAPGVKAYKLYVIVNSQTPAQLFNLSAVTYPQGFTAIVSGLAANILYPGEGHGPVVGIVNLVNIPTSPNAVTARKLYRRSGGAGLRLLATISDNTTTTYTDTKSNASLGAAPPATNTATMQTVRVSGIAAAPAGAGVIARKLYRFAAALGWRFLATINDNTTTSYTDTIPDSGLGAATLPPGNTTTGGNQTVHLSSIPTAPGATGAGAWRALYRRSGGAGLRIVAYIQNNSTTTYTDTTPNASLGAAPPTASAAVLHQIPLTNVPLGNALVTARKLYRTPANTGGGTLQLVATINDNTTTTFLDTVPDASLGAAALTVSTAQAAQVVLTAIPLGAAAVTVAVKVTACPTDEGLSEDVSVDEGLMLLIVGAVLTNCWTAIRYMAWSSATSTRSRRLITFGLSCSE